MLNWDHQQQYFEQMHMLNAMPPHLSPLSTDSNISNQFYQQPNYQQSHHLMPPNNITEKDNNDFVLIKVNEFCISAFLRDHLIYMLEIKLKTKKFSIFFKKKLQKTMC